MSDKTDEPQVIAIPSDDPHSAVDPDSEPQPSVSPDEETGAPDNESDKPQVPEEKGGSARKDPDREEFPHVFRDAERTGSEGRNWRVGLALSGGGIRSATLSLGILQGIARQGLLEKIDYLSTVSGGGYFGSFLGQLFRRENLKELAAKSPELDPRSRDEDAASVERILADDTSAPMRLLRENGCYIAPRGAPDLAVGGTVALRNLISVHVVMAIFALFVFALLSLPRYLVQASFPPESNLSPVAFGWLWVSPWVYAALVAFLALALPPGWAYWQARDSRSPALKSLIPRKWWGLWSWSIRWVPLGLLVVAGIYAEYVLLRQASPEGTRGWLTLLLLGEVTILTMIVYWLARGRAQRSARGDAHGVQTIDPQAYVSSLRRELSQWATRGLMVTLVILAVGIVDTAGQTLLLVGYRAATGTISLYAILLAILPVFRPLVGALLERNSKSDRPPLPANVLLYAGAALLLLIVLTPPAMVPHWVVWQDQMASVMDVARSFTSNPLEVPEEWRPPLLILLVTAGVLSWFMGQVFTFVNRSTLHATYEARLRRAYMGASNPARTGENETRPPVTQTHPDDGATLEEYYRPEEIGEEEEKGVGEEEDEDRQKVESPPGPIHLINVTLNQTVGGRSQIERRDRKGMGMTIGPGGISVGRRHHARWVWPGKDAPLRLEPARSTKVGGGPKRFEVFNKACMPESLDIGHWIAISGAAFSTGLGSRTNIGLSFLAGLFNIRLGYWWQSNLDPSDRAERARRSFSRISGAIARWIYPVQIVLLDEWFARFPGVDAVSWYLSDGGHFENMGAYELIRRRLPFIIICDNEQDADYTFSGLSKLVRKARTDFGADIRFLDEDGLESKLDADRNRLKNRKLKKWICPLPMLQRGRWVREPVVDPATGIPRVTKVEKDFTRFSLGNAALAKITYAGETGDGERETGLLLYIKPTLVGDEPIDVLQYHTEHPAFPHEPTVDQFFDEEQWESYRRLGEHVASKLFAEYRRGWSPRKMMTGK